MSVLVTVRSSYEYDFKIPLAAHRTVRDAVGRAYKEPDDNIRIACESAKAPSGCAELERHGYKMQLPGPRISVQHGEDAETGAVGQCWARLVMFADGSDWSVSPL
ncbi:MAG: hypothetical protein JO192_04420 [Candidatus Eremiobacteraeota bacterium]|nr:hypothetical protein [Candidatus Eremiobacteraeota bacterium]